MSLRYRTALATVISVILIMAMLLLAYLFIVREAYRDLQRDAAREELSRTKSVLRAEQQALDVLVVDWASWDDMYSFVEDRSPAFVASNLPPELLPMLNLNAFIIRNLNGDNVIGLGRDSEENATTIKGLTDAIPPGSPLLNYGSAGYVTGIISTPLGPALVASRPILRSNGSGTPRGTVVMGRLLDEAYTERLAEMLMIGISVYPLDSPDIAESIRSALARGPKDTTLTGDGREGRIAAFSYMDDLAGQPILILQTDDERKIESQSGATIRALMITVALTGAVLVIALVLVIHLTIVDRLRRLLAEMNSIAARGSSEGLRARVTGRDEIGDVASGVNAMLDRLEAAAAERTRLEQAMTDQERLAEEAFRAIDEGLIVVDGSGACTATNPAALRLLGLRQDELIGHPLTSVLPVLRPADDVTRSAGSQFFEIGARAVAVSRSIADTTGRLSVVALRDITDVRGVERLKRDLVAMVSHELRTPLTAIQATVSMLNDGDGGDLSEMQRRLVELLDRNAERLRDLVDGLLDIGALDGGRIALNRAPVDLADICRSAVDDARPAAERAGVSIRTDLNPAMAQVDPVRIRQVIENLLQNAVKFTPAGGWVEVSTHLWNHRVTIMVRDTGIGVAPEELERIFEKFYRTAEGARFAHGAGLGLSIARSIVALHGGRLSADSDGRNGTSMTVELPVDPPEER